MGERRHWLRAATLLASVALLLPPMWASQKQTARAVAPEQWEMSLEGGRTLSWERSFSSEMEVKPNRGFWNKLVDVIAGAPDYHSLVRPTALPPIRADGF
jgi:hypothetical protein